MVRAYTWLAIRSIIYTRERMTYRERYRASTNWLDKINIMRLYHCMKIIKHKDWLLRDTADYFDVSIGLASENIMLGSHHILIKECASRQEALSIVKKVK